MPSAYDPNGNLITSPGNPLSTIKSFTSSGTYTPNSNVKMISVLVVAGGGGGGSGGGISGNTFGGGGGGGGSYFQKAYNPVVTTYVVGVGGAGAGAGTSTPSVTGGTSSFGNDSALGGTGGGNANSNITPGAAGQGGANPAIADAYFSSGGQGGWQGANAAITGFGGDSFFKSTYRPAPTASGTLITPTNCPATDYGCGGCGSKNASSGTPNAVKGGDGAGGIIIITEYY